MTTTGVRSSPAVSGAGCGSGVTASATAVLLLAAPEVDQPGHNHRNRPACRYQPGMRCEFAASVDEQGVPGQFRVDSARVELKHYPQPVRFAFSELLDAVEDARQIQPGAK